MECNLFNDFQTFFSSSKLGIGIDYICIINENIVEISNEILSDMINGQAYDEKSCVTLMEFMKVIQESMKGFEYRWMRDSEGIHIDCV